MADRLNWLPAHVTAIEENRFDSLRNAAFVRGYLRAYARAVGLDEDELVAQYAAAAPEGGHEPARDKPTAGSAMQAQATGWSVAIGTFIAIAIIAAIWWQQRQSAEPREPAVAAVQPKSTAQRAADAERSPAVAAAAGDAAAVETAAVETAAVETAAVETAAGEAAAGEAAAGETAAGETVAEEAAAEDVGQTAAAIRAQAVDAARAAAGGSSEPVFSGEGAVTSAAGAVLEFSFSGDCWLEVRDGDDRLIYADLHKAGERLGLDGKAPFKVLAGNAAAVTLSFRGEPVPVRTRPGRDTARFTVGEP